MEHDNIETLKIMFIKNEIPKFLSNTQFQIDFKDTLTWDRSMTEMRL